MPNPTLFRVVAPMTLLAIASCAQPHFESDDDAPLVGTAVQEARHTPTPIRERVTLVLRPLASGPQDKRAALRTEGADFVSPASDGAPFIFISLSREAAARVARLPWAEVVAIDSVSHPRLASQTVPWNIDSIGARSVHTTLGVTGAGIKIAMLDDGVQCDHPDLDGRIKGGYDFQNNDSDYCSPLGQHGTLTAGILIAEDNTSHVVGVAPGADLYVLRVCSATSPDCDFAQILSALYWAKTNGMDIVTASIAECPGAGLPASSFIAASESLYVAGIPQVWAAGNGGCPNGNGVSPYATPSTVIAAAAHSIGGTYKSGYQYGSQVDFSAPTDVTSTKYSSTTGTHTGTSAATPHVAGLLALLMQAGFSGPDTLYQRMAETAIDAGASGVDDYYGNGRIDAAAAVVLRPSITNLSWCTGAGITSPGDCSMTATVANGVPTNQVRFVVSASTTPNDSTVYDWGSPTRDIYVPAGDYTLTVKTRARDSYHRLAAIVNTWEIPVCTTGGSSLLGPGGAQTSATSCGGGEEN